MAIIKTTTYSYQSPITVEIPEWVVRHLKTILELDPCGGVFEAIKYIRVWVMKETKTLMTFAEAKEFIDELQS